MIKTLLITFFVITTLEAKTFEDMGVHDGTFEWLRLNTPGRENVDCLPLARIQSLKTDGELKGSFEIKGDRMISTREFEGCQITEEMSLSSIDGRIATLKLENVRTNGCLNIEKVRTINVERPYDDENLNLSSTPYKMVFILLQKDIITFQRRSSQCFYAKEKH